MMVLRSILLAAVVGGALAGVLVTGLQAVRLVPLILTAEHYERHGAATGHAHAGEAESKHSDVPAGAGAEAAAGREEGWSPETPLQRTLATAFANLLTAIGFGLLLAAALALSGGADWHRGLLWGLGCYAVFVLAPSISLPPGIPGMPEGAVEARQLWWLGTVAATAVGLFLLIRMRLWYGALLGALCLVLPHLIGAPAPPIEDGPVPADIIRAYVVAAQATNLVFWIVLGAATGFLLGRFIKVPSQSA
jgi:cobalt transporter subunit CbtA